MAVVVKSSYGVLTGWNKSSEEKVSDLFEANRKNYMKVAIWIREMPKGANLHLHLLGVPTANDLIDWAIEGRLFFDPETMNFSNVETKGLVPAEVLSTNKGYYKKFCNLVSMIGNSGVTHQAPCNHFMYDCFGPRYTILQYVNAAKIVEKARKYEVLSKTCYTEMYVGLTQLQDLVQQFEKMDLDESPKTRFICEASRIEPTGFDKVISAFAGLQRRYPKYIKSLTIVGPEYDQVATRLFHQQISLLNTIWNASTNFCPLAIHAGELTLDVSDPHTLSTRLSETVTKIRNVKRVGHALSIVHEGKKGVELLKANEITVEVCLKSNKSIFHVEGEKHPLRYMLDNNVKVVLGSDDPGVFGTDFSEQFIMAFFDHNLTYLQMKKMAFDSISNSFLEGTSIFNAKGQLNPQFQAAQNIGWSPNSEISSFMKGSEKGTMEINLLQQFAHFEASLLS